MINFLLNRMGYFKKTSINLENKIEKIEQSNPCEKCKNYNKSWKQCCSERLFDDFFERRKPQFSEDMNTMRVGSSPDIVTKNFSIKDLGGLCGDFPPASLMRSKENACGSELKWFEPKDSQ